VYDTSSLSSIITSQKKTLIIEIINPILAIMPKPAAKRKEGDGKSKEEENSCRVCFPRGTTVAEFPEMPLVVTPEAVNARASTPSTIVTSMKISPSEPSPNLSAAFAAESSALNMMIPSSTRSEKIRP
jgi:hypothetical protein